jgi:ketosteroid isomerase-like protein
MNILLTIPLLMMIGLITGHSTTTNHQEGNNENNSRAKLLRELVKISQEIYDAAIKQDKDVIKYYFADSYLETDTQGELHDKKWNLENFWPKDVKVSHEIKDAQIRDYGDTAVLYYKWIVDSDSEGRKEHSELRVTDVFLKRDGKWQIIASHRTMIFKFHLLKLKLISIGRGVSGTLCTRQLRINR